MANDGPGRTVTVQKTTRTGRVLTQKIHLSKWESNRQKGNLRGNAWERNGWKVVNAKAAAEPKEAKKAVENIEA